jgi:EpsI family protein
VVTLHLAYYRDQRRGPELVNSLNRLAPTDGPLTVVSEGVRRVDAGDAHLSPVVTEVRRGSQRFLVWRWYWVDGALTSSAYLAKALQLRSRLRGHGDDGALVMLYAPSDRNAARVLGEFAADALPAITRTLEHVR